MITLTNIVDIAWLAGILEGEGHFNLKIHNNKCTPLVTLSMTDKDIVAKVADLFNKHYRKIKLYQKVTYKNLYRTEVYGNDAIAIIKLILPFMGHRRTKRMTEILNTIDKVRNVTLAERYKTILDTINVDITNIQILNDVGNCICQSDEQFVTSRQQPPKQKNTIKQQLTFPF